MIGKVEDTVWLVAALVLPVVLSGWMKSRTHLHGLATGATAVVAAWALNIGRAMERRSMSLGDAARMG